MTKHTLPATVRKITGRKVKSLRREGLLPASLFGKDIKTQNLSLNYKQFQKIYSQTGESGLVYLTLDSSNQEIPIIFSEVTTNPVSDTFLHVSLRQVSLTEKIKAPVKIELTGTAPAVADGLGVLVQQLDEVEIEALPQDFPENITLDISQLLVVDSSISVADLKLGSKLKPLTSPETIIVKIDPLAQAEPEPEPAPADSSPAEPADTTPATETPTASS